jgi:hypothetical protein
MAVANVMAKRKLSTCPTGTKGISCSQQLVTVQIYLPLLQIYRSATSSEWYHKPESEQIFRASESVLPTELHAALVNKSQHMSLYVRQCEALERFG